MSALKQQILARLDTLPETAQAEILDFMQVLEAKLERQQQASVPNGDAIARLCERIAAKNTTPSIPDPAAWQREIRQDRPLPGREA